MLWKWVTNMAGVEFAKYSSGNLGELDIHFDLDKRKKCDHSNRDIDRTKVKHDYYIGVRDWEEAKDKIEETVRKADEENPPKRVRADRKHWFCLEVPCLPEIEGTGEEDVFYKMVFEMYKKYLPGLVGGEVHKDEKHTYFDPQKKEYVESLNHLHLFGACLTDDGRINAKSLISPEMCKRVNDDIQQLCLERYGVSYQTGEGRRGSKKTVEQLKAESEVSLQGQLAKEKIEIVRAKSEEEQKLNASIEQKTEELTEKTTAIRVNEKVIVDQIEQINEQKEEISENEKTIEMQVGTMNTNKKKITEQVEKIEALETEYEKKKSNIEFLCENLMTRFYNCYKAICRLMACLFDEDKCEQADEVAEKTDEIIRTGRKSIEGIKRSIDKKEEPRQEHIETLKKADEDLEEILEEYDDDYER